MSISKILFPISIIIKIKIKNRVFENCLLYNGTEHEVGKVGMAINAEFK